MTAAPELTAVPAFAFFAAGRGAFSKEPLQGFRGVVVLASEMLPDLGVGVAGKCAPAGSWVLV